jgi:putative acetyltransferase
MSAMDVDIRRENPADIAPIDAVTAAAFLEAPHTSHTEQFIVAALRAAGALSVSLVAEAEGVVVGHVAVSPVTISDGTPGWFGLGPISVLPAWQGRGVGSALMSAALEALRELGAAGCVVLGEPAYYGRFGFKAEPRLVLPGIPVEYFQAVVFGATAVPRGHVAYHAGFDAQG